jgi:hypothetical protein
MRASLTIVACRLSCDGMPSKIRSDAVLVLIGFE